ncbi:13778_t:CDS:2 [Gigaspora margarita]|uniref:13778_t:CDS:1 n=1 Tax=Gigaspora margarita TaxID=4874 RepID=A0ABM8VZV4_GIGMA|nr:13778_t:CDS:2 [Gigaspora margarita]
MTRARNTPATRKRRKKILKQAKGYFGSKHKLFKSAKEQRGLNYSRFMRLATLAQIKLNRKQLSEMAVMFLLDNMRIRDYKIVVAHVNYHKRIDSDYDENLVRNYCQKYSLPLEIYSVGDNECQKISNSVSGLPAATRQGKLWILRPLLSLTKKQITHYLTAQKINYAVDSTNQQPIYQRNILRPYIANLKADVRLSLLKEIQKKNCELKKTKLLVKKQKKFFILSPAVFRLTTTDFSSEIHFRLLYYWINRASGGLLHTQKKKLLAEIYKQLFLSQKKNLIINLGSG